MISKSQQKREEVMKETPKFRYQCHGCTNTADLTYNCEVGVSILCQNCGMVQKAKAENYIAL